MDEKNNIFRQKSMERLSSPEQLNDYLKVTNPAVWVVLAAVIFLLAGLFIWSFFTFSWGSSWIIWPLAAIFRRPIEQYFLGDRN